MSISYSLPFRLISLLLILSSAAAAQIPSGYYNAATGSGETLKTQLFNIISANHDPLSYDGLWTAFQTTDDKTNGKVWDMYSDIPDGTPPYEFIFGSDQCGEYSTEGDCYNREHSWPSSWFGGASPMYTDLFQLIPTDGYVNNMRGNYILAQVATANWTSLNGSKRGSCATAGYSGTVFEPIDAYKGDFARNCFYMVTRYEDRVVGWSTTTIVSDILDGTEHPAFETWYLNLLMQWHTDDPVSVKETDRNNTVYTLQGNRNPFIDHPEYVGMIWGQGATPTLTVNPGSLSGFTYAYTAGPSTALSYSLSGSNLSPASGNITVTGNASFEVSLNNSTFSNSVSVPYTGSTLASATIHVRLKAGLSQGTYNAALITNAGGGASNVTVSCNGTVTQQVFPEPSNFPADFSAHNIHLQWADATGAVLPDGYLIRMSSGGFASIADPVNGTVVPDGATDKNVIQGVQQVWFSGLQPNTTYYFKIFSYRGEGAARTYKTGGSVPQVSQTTTP